MIELLGFTRRLAIAKDLDTALDDMLAVTVQLLGSRRVSIMLPDTQENSLHSLDQRGSRMPDAMPNATFGHHVIALTSWFHYGLGITIDQIVDILGYHLQTRLTPGGLVLAPQRLAIVPKEWYEQTGQQAKQSAHLHADETGWRVNGQTRWLWCFANQQVCYYMSDRCRGSPALQKFITDAFDGVLILRVPASEGGEVRQQG